MPQLANEYHPEQLLNEKQAAAFLGYTPRAMQKWRCVGSGPQFVRVSQCSIRYRLKDLTAWIDSRLRTSTSDNGKD